MFKNQSRREFRTYTAQTLAAAALWPGVRPASSLPKLTLLSHTELIIPQALDIAGAADPLSACLSVCLSLFNSVRFRFDMEVK